MRRFPQRIPQALALAVAWLASAGPVHAALQARTGGMVYDSTRNITWLADMNYAKTSGYDSDGQMDWEAANAWASSLVYGGYDDWRLPTQKLNDATCSSPNPPVSFGTHCTGGELSGLFVTDLGNKPDESVFNQAGDTAEQIANLALFINLQNMNYWSGTAVDRIHALRFDTIAGSQNADIKPDQWLAVAVRPGDVAAVPEPQTGLLMLLGLGVMTRAGKWRRRAPNA